MKLNKEEKEIVASYESGQWHSTKNIQARKKQHQEYARGIFRKDRRVNIRISSKDLESVQTIALGEGLPYQTLMASVIHKYVAGKLKSC